jgi:hypothetical protein
MTWLMRSTSRPRAATSVATRMSSLPASAVDGRSRCASGDVAVEGARRKPRASSARPVPRSRSWCARRSACRRSPRLEDARQRVELVQCRSPSSSAGGWSSAVVVLRLDRDLAVAQVRLAMLADGGGMVAENSATWRSGGVCSRIHSTSSMKPMRSISSASSSTRHVSGRARACRGACGP